jgi:hypothetical protein
MADMDDLIARLEKATGPDRKLDARICAYIEDREITFDSSGAMLGRSRRSPHDQCILWRPRGPDYKFVKAYTGSIDAAVSLLPRGCGFDLFFPSRGVETDKSEAQVWRWPQRRAVCWAATPALALCGAIMKALYKNLLVDDRAI